MSDRERDLAKAILSLADSAGMPDSFRQTDSRILLALEVLAEPQATPPASPGTDKGRERR